MRKSEWERLHRPPDVTELPMPAIGLTFESRLTALEALAEKWELRVPPDLPGERFHASARRLFRDIHRTCARELREVLKGEHDAR